MPFFCNLKCLMSPRHLFPNILFHLRNATTTRDPERPGKTQKQETETQNGKRLHSSTLLCLELVKRKRDRERKKCICSLKFSVRASRIPTSEKIGKRDFPFLPQKCPFQAFTKLIPPPKKSLPPSLSRPLEQRDRRKGHGGMMGGCPKIEGENRKARSLFGTRPRALLPTTPRERRKLSYASSRLRLRLSFHHGR